MNEPKENICNFCQKRKASFEFVGFFAAADFRKEFVCRGCYQKLIESNLKNWEATQKLNENVLVLSTAIRQGTLEALKREIYPLIKKAILDFFIEAQLMNTPEPPAGN